MITLSNKDKHLIGKDETMKDYLPEQIIDIIRSKDLEDLIDLDHEVTKDRVYAALMRGNIDLDDMMYLCVESVECMREITQALKGAGYEI